MFLHWAEHEISRLKGILGLAEVGDLIHPKTGVFVDLRKVFEANFPLRGSPLKNVALIFGFEWEAEDPGGSVSQIYLATVHNGDPVAAEKAKRRLLSYNKDDTAATAAVRDGMRGWPVPAAE